MLLDLFLVGNSLYLYILNSIDSLIINASASNLVHQVVTEDHDNLEDKTTWQIVPVSFYEGKPLEEVTVDCSLPLISAEQYASRNEMLMSLVVAWSPILETSTDGVALPHNSSNYCSILAVGGKCGRISLWRVCAPECYSNDNTEHSREVSLVGLLKAHDSWITAISWAAYGSGVSKTQFALATGSCDGRCVICIKPFIGDP